MATAPNTKVYDPTGSYLIYRKIPRGLSVKVGGAKVPNFRHKTFEAAEAEARRLLALFPESTFIILHEVARVKLKPVIDTAAFQALNDENNTMIAFSNGRLA